jgi:hypothetical protein
LSHRVVTADFSAAGAVIGTHHTALLLLGPPVRGADWLADDAPSNDQENHHRRGILIFEGRVQISRRYAIDWQQIEKGTTFSGDARDKRSYYAYGKPVLAVADGTVVTARDGLPDHVRRGQLLAQIGDSGDAREPHLHFQVSTSSDLLAGGTELPC